MYLTARIPKTSPLHARLDGARVELVASNDMYANCSHPQIGHLQLPVEWLVLDSGITLDQHRRGIAA